MKDDIHLIWLWDPTNLTGVKMARSVLQFLIPQCKKTCADQETSHHQEKNKLNKSKLLL